VGHTSYVWSLAFSPDGTQPVASTELKMVHESLYGSSRLSTFQISLDTRESLPDSSHGFLLSMTVC
jgi:WD40 repeat protein